MSRELLSQSASQDEQLGRQGAEATSAAETATSSFGGSRSLGPRGLGPQHLLSIQRSLGNQAAMRYLQREGVIQRQEGEGDGRDDVEIPELDPEITRLLDDLFGPNRETAPTEVISSSTGAELTHAGLTPAIADMWQRFHIPFVEAARDIAEGNTIEGNDSVPTQSGEFPDPRGRAYTRRWGAIVANSDYPDTEGDLPSVHEALAAGSPFSDALTGSFDQQRVFENLSAADTLSNLRLVINELMLTLNGDETAELVIYLSGHGSNGDFIGVDNEHVMIHDLRELGEMARQYRIHPVIVLDVCTGGSAVQTLQEGGITYLQGRISVLPPDQQAVAREQLRVISDFALWMDSVSYTAANIRSILHFDPLSPDVDPLGTEPAGDEGNYFQNLRLQLVGLRELLDSGRMDILAEPAMAQFRTHFEAAVAWIDDITVQLELAGGPEHTPLRPIARVLDDANTVMNNVLRRIDEQVHAATGAGVGP